MELTINGKKAELKFGVRFVRELDKLRSPEVENVKVGMALNVTLPVLTAHDPAVIADYIYCAAYKNHPRPTQAEVDNFLDNDADFDKLADQIVQEVKESNVIKGMAKKYLKA